MINFISWHTVPVLECVSLFQLGNLDEYSSGVHSLFKSCILVTAVFSVLVFVFCKKSSRITVTYFSKSVLFCKKIFFMPLSIVKKSKFISGKTITLAVFYLGMLPEFARPQHRQDLARFHIGKLILTFVTTPDNQVQLQQLQQL